MGNDIEQELRQFFSEWDKDHADKIDGGELTGKHEFKINELNLVELEILKHWLKNQLCEGGDFSRCYHPHGHCEKCGSHRISFAYRREVGKEIGRCSTCGNEWEHKSKSEGDEKHGN